MQRLYFTVLDASEMTVYSRLEAWDGPNMPGWCECYCFSYMYHHWRTLSHYCLQWWVRRNWNDFSKCVSLVSAKLNPGSGHLSTVVTRGGYHCSHGQSLSLPITHPNNVEHCTLQQGKGNWVQVASHQDDGMGSPVNCRPEQWWTVIKIVMLGIHTSVVVTLLDNLSMEEGYSTPQHKYFKDGWFSISYICLCQTKQQPRQL